MMYDAVDDFYRTIGISRLKRTSRVSRQGPLYRVKVPHTVGFGGSRIFTIRGAATKESAVEAVWMLLRGDRR